jgi:hypothetical protein
VTCRVLERLQLVGFEHHVAILLELVALDHVGPLDDHVLLQAQVLLLDP